MYFWAYLLQKLSEVPKKERWSLKVVCYNNNNVRSIWDWQVETLQTGSVVMLPKCIGKSVTCVPWKTNDPAYSSDRSG